MANSDNNYCACTGTDAQFKLVLNQQGPPGKKGEQGVPGVDGISPQITVAQDTDTSYVLKVTTAFTSFNTPNLLADATDAIEALDTKLSADIAELDADKQDKLTAGSNISISNNTISVTGIPTKVSQLTNDAGYLTAVPDEYVTDTELTAKGYATINQLPTVTGGDNVTVTHTGNNYKIDVDIPTPTTPTEPTGSVTLDTDQTITGAKTFSAPSKLLVDVDQRDSSGNGYTYTVQSITPYSLSFTSGSTTTNVHTVQSNYNYKMYSGGEIISSGTRNIPLATINNINYGIKGNYATHYGIIDCPNGLLTYNATGKSITLNAGIVLQLTGQTNKTTIASPITKTLTSSEAITLFYGGGELIECGQVFYTLLEPTYNGITNYQAWYNPIIDTWKFRSNDTGNVWRELSATPIANINLNASNITRVDYIGYRILDDDLLKSGTQLSTSVGDVVDMDMTANGTIGGDTKACTASTNNSEAWKAFSAIPAGSNSYWSGSSSGWSTITFYNPTPVLIKSLNCWSYNVIATPQSIILKGSNDGLTYVDIGYISLVGATTNSYKLVTTTSNKYKYFQFNIEPRGNGYNPTFKVLNFGEVITTNYDNLTLDNQSFTVDNNILTVNSDPGGTIQTQINSLQTQITDIKTNTLDNLKLKKITQTDYNALTTKDDNTLYVIVEGTA